MKSIYEFGNVLISYYIPNFVVVFFFLVLTEHNIKLFSFVGERVMLWYKCSEAMHRQVTLSFIFKVEMQEAECSPQMTKRS
jgi:hypothetical protein